MSANKDNDENVSFTESNTESQITIEQILYAEIMIPESTIVVTRGRLIKMDILAVRRDRVRLSLMHI